MAASFDLAHPQPYKLTVDDFMALAETGAFDKNLRTELIDGEIFTMNALFRPHAYNHTQMLVAIENELRKLDQGLSALTAPSVRMQPTSMPEPDILVASGPFDLRQPVAIETVRLAIEIADSTVTFDLVRKGRLYAQHGVPEYWVVDIGAKVIHQLWRPSGNNFAERAQHDFGAQLVAATIGGLVIETTGLI